MGAECRGEQVLLLCSPRKPSPHPASSPCPVSGSPPAEFLCFTTSTWCAHWCFPSVLWVGCVCGHRVGELIRLEVGPEVLNLSELGPGEPHSWPVFHGTRAAGREWRQVL